MCFESLFTDSVNFVKSYCEGLRNGEVDISTGYSSRKPWFDFQHSLGGSQLSVKQLSVALSISLITSIANTCMWHKTNAHIHKTFKILVLNGWI